MKQSIAYGIEKLGVPCVVVRSKEQNLYFLIDTGSTANHLIEYTYLYFKQFDDVIEDSEKSFTTTGLGGSAKTRICSFKFSIGRTPIEDDFVLLPNSQVFENMSKGLGEPIAGILGGKFLKKNHIVIDYENKCLYTKRIRKKRKDNETVQ